MWRRRQQQLQRPRGSAFTPPLHLQLPHVSELLGVRRRPLPQWVPRRHRHRHLRLRPPRCPPCEAGESLSVPHRSFYCSREPNLGLYCRGGSLAGRAWGCGVVRIRGGLQRTEVEELYAVRIEMQCSGRRELGMLLFSSVSRRGGSTPSAIRTAHSAFSQVSLGNGPNQAMGRVRGASERTG